jgi:hypothetical protein
MPVYFNARARTHARDTWESDSGKMLIRRGEIVTCRGEIVTCRGDSNLPRRDSNSPWQDSNSPWQDSNSPRRDSNSPWRDNFFYMWPFNASVLYWYTHRRIIPDMFKYKYTSYYEISIEGCLILLRGVLIGILIVLWNVLIEPLFSYNALYSLLKDTWKSHINYFF